MKKYYSNVIEACDRAVSNHLARTIMDKDNPNYGGIYSPAEGYVTPGASIGCMLSYTPAYYNENSRHYKSPVLMEAMNRALGFTEKVQRGDGTFDLLVSNFYSAPDTGFIMHNIGRVYKIMNKHARTEEELKLRERLYNLIYKAAVGLRDGGFHTPNHRWVESAGLSLAYNITRDESFKDMVLMYLAEGIDIDENGEFTERSPGIYNAVSDNALMILAEEMGMPELAAHAYKNLRMMFHYFEPDGSVFTQNSVRVDKGEGMPDKAFYPNNYFFIYLQAAFDTKDPLFAKTAEMIAERASKTPAGIPGVLWLYMVNDGMDEFTPEIKELPVEYEAFYEPSNIVRMRKGDLSISLMAGSPNFLFVQKGELRCYARMCASFFAVAQFVPKKITKTTEGYSMEFTAKGSYKWPFETKQDTTVWDEMDHTSRKYVKHLELKYSVDFRFTDTGITMDVKTEGCDRVPMKIEFCFSGGSLVEGPGFMADGTAGGSIIAGEGNVRVSKALDAITVGPGFAEHRYAASLRGSVPKSINDYTVYFTGYTNIDKTIEITTNTEVS